MAVGKVHYTNLLIHGKTLKMVLTLKVLLRYWELHYHLKNHHDNRQLRDEFDDIYKDYIFPHNMRLAYGRKNSTGKRQQLIY
jgi:hypothetical protein